MLGILLIFVLSAASLALLFWLGGMFLQGYLYTQPSENMHWQAPVAGLAVGTFFTAWCWMIFASPVAAPTNLPYDTLFRFSAKDEMFTEPVKELRAQPKIGKAVVYKRQRLGQDKYVYLDTSLAKRPWNHDAQAIFLIYKDEEFRFEPVEAYRGGYRIYASDKGGWEMPIYDDGPSGIPVTFRYGRFTANILLNLGHFLLWFACLWLLMRFLPSHALLLAIGLWLVATLLLLPMLFSYAGDLAQQRRKALPSATAISGWSPGLNRRSASPASLAG